MLFNSLFFLALDATQTNEICSCMFLALCRLPSLTSDDHSQPQGLTRESLIKAKEWLVDLVETSLEAGKMSKEELTQSASDKGGPVTPVSRTNLATFKVVTNRTLFRKAKEWMVYFIEECLEAWPDASQDDLPQHFCKG